MADGKRGRPRKDHGTTYAQQGYWYFKLGVEKSDGSKQWLGQSSGIPVGLDEVERKRNHRKAEEIRKQAQNAINASQAEFGAVGAGITTAQFAQRFFTERERLGVKSWKAERQRISDYVVPEIGTLKLLDVRPRHLIDMYGSITSKTYRAEKLLSQKTVDETHRTLGMLFQYAVVLDLIPGSDNPCNQVGPRYRRSKARYDPRARRGTGSFTTEEIAILTSHHGIPLCWRCLFGVESLAMTRAGEAGRLRFGDWDPTKENISASVGQRTLGELFVDGQKTEKPRWVPVHPALSALLSEWKLKGFQDAFGRRPQPADVMFPYMRKPGSRKEHGSPVTSK